MTIDPASFAGLWMISATAVIAAASLIRRSDMKRRQQHHPAE